MSELLISPDGTVRVLYADELMPLLHAVGEVTVRRASMVEPAAGGGWCADMAPVGGEVLGPFSLRSEALAAEVAWLLEHDTPIPNEKGAS